MHLVSSVIHAPKSLGQTFQILVQKTEVPLLRKLTAYRNRNNNVVDQIIQHFHDIWLDIFSEQNLTALIVDNFSLLVHNVIILENVFSDLEVTAFYFFLRIFDRLGKHSCSNRFILHSKFLHNPLDPVATE